MFYVERDKIYITKGDYGKLSIDLVDGNDEPYTMQTGDRIVFTAKHIPDDINPCLIIRSITNSIVFDPEDTKHMTPGTYSADIQLDTPSGKKITFWPKLSGNRRIDATINFKNFIIMPEVTTE